MKSAHRPYAIFLIAMFFFCSPGIANAAPELMAYWSFDKATDTTFIDESDHGYNASSSGISLSKGVKGQALNCTGSGYEVGVAKSKDAFCVQQLTIEAWINVRSIPAEHGKILDFSYIQSGVRNGFSLAVINQGYMQFTISSSNKNLWINAISTTQLGLNRWYHIAASFDGSVLQVYINGKLDASTWYSGTIGYPVGIDARIGCQRRMDSSLPMYYFTGKIDELSLYNRALSADSISAHFNAIAPVVKLVPYTPNPTANQRPILQWYANKSVLAYRIQIADNTSFSSPIVSVPTSDTFFVPTVNLPAKTLYWRVGNDADTSAYSAISSVTILDPAVPLLVPYVPDPTLNHKPVLTWHTVTGSTLYTIQITNNGAFAAPLIIDGVNDTSYAPASSLPHGTISWRVKSSQSEQYSIPDTFKILNDSIPVIIAMVPDTQVNRKPVFAWHRATGAALYRLQIDSLGNFSSPIISLPVEDTTYTPSVNMPMGKICWRVSANFDFSQFSNVDTFWVQPPSNAVYQQGSRTKPEKLSASWNSLKRGIEVSYELEKPGFVSLKVFALNGTCLATIYNGFSEPGKRRFTWMGVEGSGRGVSCGRYLIAGQCAGKQVSKIVACGIKK